MASKSKTNNKEPSSRSAAAQKAAAARVEKREALRRSRETRGVICLAVAVLLGIYLFISGTGIVGKTLSRVLFGLFGWPAYVLPVLFLIIGLLIIRSARESRSAKNADWMFFAGIWDILTLAEVIRNIPYSGVEYFKYIATAYTDGSMARRGGGAVGAIMCYAFQQIGGNALAYVILIAFLLIILITVTRFSLHDAGEKVTQRVQSATRNVSERAHNKLFTMELVEDRPAEEFDNPFLPGRKQKPESELEGFHSVADSIPKKKKSASGLDSFNSAADALPADTGDTSERPVRTRTTVSHAKTPRQVVPIEESSTFAPPIKPSPRRRREESVTDQVWNDLDATIPAKPAPQRPRVDRVDPEPFAPLTRTYDVPSFLNPSSAGSSAPIVPGFIAEPKDQPVQDPEVKAPKIRPVSKPAAQKNPPEDDKPSAAEPPVDITVSAPVAEYAPPPVTLLAEPKQGGLGSENPSEAAQILVDTLASFNIAVKITNYSVGPVVTRFELQPAPGVRVSKIMGLSNDIALALAAPRVRIEAPIPGKAAVGIEIPNKKAIPVVLREIVESKEFNKATSPITLAFGKDIAGNVITADLAKMPHLLIAGSTGSGKSVCINDLIVSMVYKSSPADLRMILVDPKVVELSVYGSLPHLLIPVVTEPKKAASALRWAVNEMMKRYKLFSEVGARELERYNSLQKEASSKLPKLVVIIDELADLMMVAPDEVEDSICRIAQLGRAAGIHLIVATQRPSADIITGLIKANIPSRCAFAVSSGIDSRIILDAMGAEKLLGRGDMLFHPTGASKATRVQCAFISDEEVERVMDYFSKQEQTPSFDEKFVTEVTAESSGGSAGQFGEGKQEDELLPEALKVVLENNSASISMIQRRLRVGYARAARLIDIMEQHGYVSGFEGSKPRRVLIKQSEFNQLYGGEAGTDAENPEEFPDEDVFSSYDEEPEA
ncbi:MAG: DNA translocase FtsK 4TM domain-containing protein [Clostridia bacterium]|nr:DNA translocase FtsK 4TM domain-containing protein [Clostridia bacterium]